MKIYLNDSVLIVISAVFILCILVKPAASDEKRSPTSRSQIQLSFAPLVKRASPTVVNISTNRMVNTRNFSPLFDDPFFRQFFGDRSQLGSRRKKRVQNSLGSGVIVRSDGTIITNHHVVAGADEIKVVLADRREFDARVVGSDKRTDLAILKIEPGALKLPFLLFRDSDDLEVGDIVLAIGNPFGLGQTVTSGIISALARTQVGINNLNFFIQTDASINPGNSGGALITMDGRLIGINSAIYSNKGGGSVGIGFAIPSNMVRSVLAGMTSKGRIVRPWAGVEGQAVNAEIAASIGLKRPIGVLVIKIFPKGPADKAGIHIGDIIIELNGRETNDLEALKFRIATQSIGERVPVKLIRRGSLRQVVLQIKAPPYIPIPNRTQLKGLHPLQGATVANLSPALLDELGIISQQTGVIILKSQRGKVANRLGFKLGDIVLKINGHEIDKVSTLKKLVAHTKDSWKVLIKRGDDVLSLLVPG